MLESSNKQWNIEKCLRLLYYYIEWDHYYYYFIIIKRDLKFKKMMNGSDKELR